MVNGDIVRVKEEHAFEISCKYHYGEVVGINLNASNEQEINLKADLIYGHDSSVWIESKYYEKI